MDTEVAEKLLGHVQILIHGTYNAGMKISGNNTLLLNIPLHPDYCCVMGELRNTTLTGLCIICKLN